MANFTERNETSLNQGSNLTQTQTNDGMITHMFPDKDSANTAYKSYLDQGYSADDINVMMSEDTRKKYFDSDNEADAELVEKSKATKGLGVGGAIGATIGAILAGIAATGTNLVIPGLGLVVAGPLAAALAGAGAGSISGGLIGALIGWGIPEEQAKEYERGLKSGGILLGVNRRPGVDYSNLENEWNNKNNPMQH